MCHRKKKPYNRNPIETATVSTDGNIRYQTDYRPVEVWTLLNISRPTLYRRISILYRYNLRFREMLQERRRQNLKGFGDFQFWALWQVNQMYRPGDNDQPGAINQTVINYLKNEGLNYDEYKSWRIKAKAATARVPDCNCG